MKYSIRPYKEDTDSDGVLAVLHQHEMFADATVEKIRGIGMVAVDDDTGSIVGFFWALVGLSSIAYFDYLAVDKNLETIDRENVWIDLCTTLLSVLSRCNVQEVIFGVANSRVQRVLSLLGFETMSTLIPMRGDVAKVSEVLEKIGKTIYLPPVRQPEASVGG